MTQYSSVNKDSENESTEEPEKVEMNVDDLLEKLNETFETLNIAKMKKDKDVLSVLGAEIAALKKKLIDLGVEAKNLQPPKLIVPADSNLSLDQELDVEDGDEVKHEDGDDFLQDGLDLFAESPKPLIEQAKWFLSEI